jgi:predicted transcriptional regulator
MARRRSAGLTEREAEILAILWREGEATVEQIRSELEDRPTTATVRKLLALMRERGLVDGDGRRPAPRYRALHRARVFQGPATRRLLDTHFGGSAYGLVRCLVDEGWIDGGDLLRLAERRGGHSERGGGNPTG